jgi:hypothetical protein
MADMQTLLEAFLNKSLRSAHFNDDAFFWYKVKFPVLGLVFSSARLSGILNYQILDQRNFSVCCEMP